MLGCRLSDLAVTGCWHTAMPNTSKTARHAVILGWAASATRWATPTTTGGLLSEAHEARLVASGLMTPLLQTLTAATFTG